MPAHSSAPLATDLGRLLAKGVDYATHYAVELLLIALIVYLCVSRGLTVGIDVYEPGSPAVTDGARRVATSSTWSSAPPR